MTPKEKAESLVNKMDGFTYEDCKRNALVCVDEIIFELNDLDTDIVPIEYWEYVKEEINKL